MDIDRADRRAAPTRRRSRRSSAARLALASLAVLAAGLPGCSDAPGRPNVLLVVLDTVRTDHLSVYGYPWPTTPRLEALAARGVVFDDCTAQSSWTMPSMISLMTGRPIFRSVWRVPDEVPLLAESFDAAGYATAGFVANSVLATDAGFDRGFEAYAVREKNRRQWDAPDVTGRALAFLEQRDARPFFLWLHYLDPHAPYAPPELPWLRTADDLLQPFEREAMQAGIARAPESEQARLVAQLPQAASAIDRYDGELAALDASLGRVLDALAGQGLDDDTYVVVVGDHGETLFRRPQHPARTAELAAWRARQGQPVQLEDYVKKEHNTYVYEELVRTPFIVAGPGLAAPRRSDALVSNLDVFPTLLGLCGLDDRAARGGQGWGRDLSDELRAGAPVPSAPFVTSSTDAMMAAKLPDGRKLIVPYPEQRSAWGFDIEWFDLETDPHELRPLPLDADAERLLERLRGFRQGGPFVRWSEQVLDEDTIGRLRELGYIR